MGFYCFCFCIVFCISFINFIIFRVHNVILLLEGQFESKLCRKKKQISIFFWLSLTILSLKSSLFQFLSDFKKWLISGLCKNAHFANVCQLTEDVTFVLKFDKSYIAFFQQKPKQLTLN